jgi:hypothetical protein
MTKEQKQKIDDFFDSHTTEELRDKWEKYAGMDEPKEQFSLHGVSHRRELLINFRDWCDTNLNYDGIFDSEIDTYLKDKIK